MKTMPFTLATLIITAALTGCEQPVERAAVQPENITSPQPAAADKANSALWRPVSQEQLREGWVALFDGKTLFGWRVVPNSQAEFAVEDGTIHVVGGAGFLETTQTYGDFVLQFEAKLNAADVNSGLFFRAEEGTEVAPSNGYELQLQNTIADGDRTKPADYGTGFGTGAIFRRQKARYINANDGEWFSVTLVAVGNHMATWVNGLQVTDFTDERALDDNPRKGRRDAAGHISLQGHDATTDASFRNIRIVPLNANP